MRYFLLAVSLFFFTGDVSAQFYSKAIWQKCLGGTDQDIGYSIIQARDGGFVMAGWTMSKDGDVTGIHDTQWGDGWIVKLSASGNLEWEKCLGGTYRDVFNSVVQTSDGGFVAAGYTESNDGDVTGNHGYNNPDAWVVKLDSAGKLLWQKCFGTKAYEKANSIVETADGGFILAGSTDSISTHGAGGDVFVAKLNSNGDLEWQKIYGGNDVDVAVSILQTYDGGYVFAGTTASSNGDVKGLHNPGLGFNDIWVVKINSTGTIIWQKCLGGSRSDKAGGIIQTSDSGLVVCGTVESKDGDVSGKNEFGVTDGWVAKLSASGDIIWKKCIGGNGDDVLNAIIRTNDGGFAVGGETNTNDDPVALGNDGIADFWTVKLDPQGNVQWGRCFGSPEGDEALAIIQTTDGALLEAGYTESNGDYVKGFHGPSSSDAWVIKYTESSGVHSVAPEIEPTLFPNPANNIINLDAVPATVTEVNVINVMGETVMKLHKPDSPGFSLDLSKLNPGTYYIRFSSPNSVVTKKIVKN